MEEKQGRKLGECHHASWSLPRLQQPRYQFPPPLMASRPFLHLLAETILSYVIMNFWLKSKKCFPCFILSDLSTPLAWLATN